MDLIEIPEIDILTFTTWQLRTEMWKKGVDVDVQLRTLCIAGWLHDQAVVQWMLDNEWHYSSARSLVQFVLQAPASKALESLELTLLGKSKRNADAFQPLWTEILESYISGQGACALPLLI